MHASLLTRLEARQLLSGVLGGWEGLRGHLPSPAQVRSLHRRLGL